MMLGMYERQPISRGMWGLANTYKLRCICAVFRKSGGYATDVRSRRWRFESSSPTPIQESLDECTYEGFRRRCLGRH